MKIIVPLNIIYVNEVNEELIFSHIANPRKYHLIVVANESEFKQFIAKHKIEEYESDYLSFQCVPSYLGLSFEGFVEHHWRILRPQLSENSILIPKRSPSELTLLPPTNAPLINVLKIDMGKLPRYYEAEYMEEKTL